MKKYVKIALLVIVALIFIGTFVFLYQKSQPKASVYTICLLYTSPSPRD
mgnify:CR=1 FL=1